MAHIHGVVDMDKHFVIDAATREITNQSEKITLMQNDHNSERFTFQIPKEVDGHDMSLCNVVQVHYLNIDASTKAQNPGVYTVEDLQISPDNEATVIGSWLISSAATKYVGNLNFIFRFLCTAEDGSIEYAWSSAIFKGISIGSSINGTEAVAEEYADIFLQWQARIEALEQGGTGSGSGLTEEQAAEIAANTEARHTHDNKDILDKFGINTAKTRPTFFSGTKEEVLATQFDVTSRMVTKTSELQNDSGFITEPNLNEAVETALAEAKVSGEFDGTDGKSAYTYAQEGGYTGTEEEFAEKLAEGAPKAFYVNISANDDGTYTADKTVAEIKTAYDDGRSVYAIAEVDGLPYIHNLVSIFEEDVVYAFFAASPSDAFIPVVLISDDFVEVIQQSLRTETLTIRIGDKTISYNGTSSRTLAVSSLPNPNALTINGKSYNGSDEVDFTDTINGMINEKLGVIENGSY